MSDATILCHAVHEGRTFQIVDDGSEVGFYLYVFEAGRCTHDFLQDTVQFAKECAEEEFSVPAAAWTASPTNA